MRHGHSTNLLVPPVLCTQPAVIYSSISAVPSTSPYHTSPGSRVCSRQEVCMNNCCSWHQPLLLASAPAAGRLAGSVQQYDMMTVKQFFQQC